MMSNIKEFFIKIKKDMKEVFSSNFFGADKKVENVPFVILFGFNRFELFYKTIVHSSFKEGKKTISYSSYRDNYLSGPIRKSPYSIINMDFSKDLFTQYAKNKKKFNYMEFSWKKI